MVLSRQRVPTPIGELTLLASETGLAFLEFPHRAPASGSRKDRGLGPKALRRMAKWFASPIVIDEPSPHGTAARQWLDRFFSGEPVTGRELALDLRGTDFEVRVWERLLDIPPGETMSYGELARALNTPLGSRAVGLANGANPISIIVPCHRVIGADGTLTGYGGGLERKRWLLAHEADWRTGRLF